MPVVSTLPALFFFLLRLHKQYAIKLTPGTRTALANLTALAFILLALQRMINANVTFLCMVGLRI
jgi:hypothetical protein